MITTVRERLLNSVHIQWDLPAFLRFLQDQVELSDDVRKTENLRLEVEQSMSATERPSSSDQATAMKNKPEDARREKSELRFTTAVVCAELGEACPMCGGNHLTDECSRFLKHPVPERCRCVRRLHLCFVCLQKEHRRWDCLRRKPAQTRNVLLEWEAINLREKRQRDPRYTRQMRAKGNG
ncbi:hypothetical protein T03_7981 [Trichinella britovi]|uniref:Uncharacterized protein n=1 Tax=Trichinella britovi TaxID=45882 RepID=A0A0V1CRP8_TRIBR|nr:hypothetical protein T03_7981 [Trichinella britovi]